MAEKVEDEEPEIISAWEKRVEARLTNVENLLTEILQKGKSTEKKSHERKPTTSMVQSLVKQCLDWFGAFDVDKFIQLAKERDLTSDESFSDTDLTYIHSVLPDWDGLILEASIYEESVKKLCEALNITPARFEELKTFSQSILELARKKLEKAPLSSEIEVSEISKEE